MLPDARPMRHSVGTITTFVMPHMQNVRGDLFGGELMALVDAYLSDEHVAAREEGCSIAAAGSEVPRQHADVRRASRRRIKYLIGLIEGQFPEWGESAAHDKAMAIAATLVGSVILARAVDDKAVDPVGTWKCEYEIGGQQRTSTLKIKKDGDNLAGTMSWPDQDETKLKDLKLKDGTLTFSAERKLPGMDDGIHVEYKLTVDGDKLKGKGSAEFGGQKQSFDINGKREKKDK